MIMTMIDDDSEGLSNDGDDDDDDGDDDDDSNLRFNVCITSGFVHQFDVNGTSTTTTSDSKTTAVDMAGKT